MHATRSCGSESRSAGRTSALALMLSGVLAFGVREAAAAPPAKTGRLVLSTNALAQTVQAGLNAASKTFSVSGTGASKINYSIASSVPWATVSPASGSSAGEWDAITVSFSSSTLAPGNYSGTLSISSGQATNSPQAVALTLTVSAAPAVASIALSTQSIAQAAEQGMNPTAQTFKIWNSGRGTMTYSITSSAPWLAVSPASGSSTGEQDTILLSYNTASLAVGTYSGTVSVSAALATNSPRTVSVVVGISAPPPSAVIALSTNAIAQASLEGQNATARTFEVWNSGGGTMTYAITSSAPWLIVSPASGSSTGEQDSISISYNAAFLSAGSYSGIVSVASAQATNSARTLFASLVITKPPVATSGVAKLAWEPVTTNADGTPVTGTTYYRIYCGTNSRTYTRHVDAGTLTTGTVTGLRTDTVYYFAVTAMDPLGGESEYSEEVWWRAPAAPENAPAWGSVDIDDDGLPDAWEAQYFPDAQAQSVDPSADADDDGRSNLEEFIAGTDPSKEDEEPKLEIASSSEGLPTITFQTVQAVGTGYSPVTRFYALESCTNLAEGRWTTPPGLNAIEASDQVVVFSTDAAIDPESAVWRTRVWLQ